MGLPQIQGEAAGTSQKRVDKSEATNIKAAARAFAPVYSKKET